MFSEYLDRQPIRALLTQSELCMVPPSEDRAAWENIPDAFRQEIGQMTAQYAMHPYPMRKATDFLAFVRWSARRIFGHHDESGIYLGFLVRREPLLP